MIRKPQIHPMAERHIRELRERWQVEPTLEECLWIVQLVDRVLNPVAGTRMELAEIPERVGVSDEWLHPITIGAALWFNELASAWWADDRDGLFKALAWMMAHSRDRELFAMAATREAAAALIHDWALSLTCTRAELEAAVDRTLPSYDGKGGDEAAKRQAMDWPALITELEVATGLPARHWLWELSREATIRAWWASRSIIAAQGGRSSSAGPNPADEAVQALASAKLDILKAHGVTP